MIRTVREGLGQLGARRHLQSVNHLPLAKTLQFRQGRVPMIPSEDVRKYAAEQGIVEEKALKKGTEEKSEELVEKSAEVYAKV